MKSKILSFFAVLIALAHLTVPVSATENSNKFTDVPSDSWYAEPIAWAVDQGITTGTSSTTFSPNDTCTNAQVITFIWRACGEPEPDIDNPFVDVSADKYYYKAALWAYVNEMVTDSSFQANKPCTRSMAVTYLWKVEGSPEVTSNSRFTDVDAHASYAHAVAWAVETGITDGTGIATFSPSNTCTRAHIVTFLYRDFVGIGGADLAPGLDMELITPPAPDSSSEELPISTSDSEFDSGNSYLEIIP